MLNSHIIDGKEFLPAIAAGKHFGYSKDYLLLLIKNGKINGTKIGNKWYVDISSAELFFAHAEQERQQKRRQMSIERKLELQQHDTTKRDTQRYTALIETFTILIIGLAVGATGYLGTTAQVGSVAETQNSFLENIAISLYQFVSGGEEVVLSKTDGMADDSNRGNAISTSSEPVDAVHVEAQQPGLVVAPKEDFPAAAVQSVRDSFSDEVEVAVDPESPDTGIVIPKFKNTDGDSYRFLMVPVSKN